MYIYISQSNFRYERKMQAQEDRMRALGLMEPITMLALDEWEVARDRVVINRLERRGRSPGTGWSSIG